MPNGWRTINSLVHKIRLHGRRGKGMAESFWRQKSRHAPQKEGGLKFLCDLPPVWPRLVRPTNLMSRMDGKKTHTHIAQFCSMVRNEMEWNNITPGSSGSPPLLRQHQHQHGGYGSRSGTHSCRGWDAIPTRWVTVYSYFYLTRMELFFPFLYGCLWFHCERSTVVQEYSTDRLFSLSLPLSWEMPHSLVAILGNQGSALFVGNEPYISVIHFGCLHFECV